MIIQIVQRLRKKNDMLVNTIVFHQRMNEGDFTTCNRKSSYNWIKYNANNFQKGTVFNIKLGGEVEIPGRRCEKCLKLKFNP